MAGFRVVVVALLVCCACSVLQQTLASDDAQCSDAVAKTIIKAAGGKSRLVVFLLNFVKCLQKGSNDMYKLVNELLIELTSCLSRNDIIDVVKCMVNDPGMKKISALVAKSMDMVKCGLEAS